MKSFLKWAGGKKQILEHILSNLPSSFNKYHEMMVGGGAAFFALQRPGSRINDSNSELINAYRGIRDNPEVVMDAFEQMPQSAEAYSNIAKADRGDDWTRLSQAEKATRFLYLNKLGYNGLYRVNKRGQYNVPYGKRTGVTLDREAILQASILLQQCYVTEADVLTEDLDIARGDFAYFDPPYIPLSETSSFVAYTASGFGMEHHQRLRDVIENLTCSGVHVMVSNSDTLATRRLYEGLNVRQIFARRSINSKPSRRGAVPELLITNY